jgi:hypothetical protein
VAAFLDAHALSGDLQTKAAHGFEVGVRDVVKIYATIFS